MRYEADVDGDSFAVFSEIYTAEGWRAYVDNVEVTPLRANYVLRALEIPAGKHIVEWRYRAPRWALIEGITLGFSIIVLIAIVLTIIIPIINARRQKTQA